MAERLHAIVTETVPELAPNVLVRPALYARAGKVMCCSRSGQVDKERYSSLGFTTNRSSMRTMDVADVFRPHGVEREG